MRTKEEIIEGLERLAGDFEKVSKDCKIQAEGYAENGYKESADKANTQRWVWLWTAHYLKDFVEEIQ